jgi:hypothetical protein
MNEIEYAIKQLERRADAVSSIGEFEEYNALTTALTVLRAEFARQDAKPLTWNERINQMTVEEKAKFIDNITTECPYVLGYSRQNPCDHYEECQECWIEFLNSPYTEGATE